MFEGKAQQPCGVLTESPVGFSKRTIKLQAKSKATAGNALQGFTGSSINIFFAFSALYSGCSNAIGMQEHLSLYRNTRHPKHFYINMLSTKTSTGGTRLRNSKVLEPTKSFWILAKAVGLLRMQQYPMNHFRQAKP